MITGTRSGGRNGECAQPAIPHGTRRGGDLRDLLAEKTLLPGADRKPPADRIPQHRNPGGLPGGDGERQRVVIAVDDVNILLPDEIGQAARRRKALPDGRDKPCRRAAKRQDMRRHAEIAGGAGELAVGGHGEMQRVTIPVQRFHQVKLDALAAAQSGIGRDK